MEGCGTCWGGACGACRGGMKIVFGLLLLVWAYWWTNLDWRIFFGVVIAVGGLLKMIKPYCGHCESCAMPMKKRR